MKSGARIETLAKRWLDRTVEFDPVGATYLGIHKGDGLMPDGTQRAVLREIAEDRKLCADFRRVPSAGLSPEQKIDRELAIQTLKLRLFRYEVLQQWKSMPEAAFVVGDSLYPFMVRDFAPMKSRLRSALARMRAIPRYVEQTKERLTAPVKVWVETAIRILAGTHSLVALVVDAGRGVFGARDQSALARAAEGVRSSMNSFVSWLEKDVLPRAREEFAIGPKNFANLTRLRRLGLTPAEIFEFGERQLKSAKEKIAETARLIDPSASVEQVRARVRAKCPATFKEAINAVRGACAEAKRFVVEHGFASVPDDESLEIVETPEFIRPLIPFGAYMSPGRFDKKQAGLYFVTPVPDGSVAMQEHNYAALKNMSVHEAYPGHHLQLVCANRNESLVRVFADGMELCEGWAHYCEERVKELGFDDTPEARLVQLIDVAWRAARIVIDVKLSSGEMGFDEAVAFLSEQTGIEREPARVEVTRYTMSPGYQLSYLLGREMVKDFRRELERKLGSDFSERQFHDAILYAGTLPMNIMRKEVARRLKKSSR
ncbi:MAG: DUF885 domain-containing protein [Planctomycetota bacterium]|nr:DUF885 domain-containing protein [Planctomycetota bacterium]